MTGDEICADLARPKTAIVTADHLDETNYAIPASTATIGLPSTSKSQAHRRLALVSLADSTAARQHPQPPKVTCARRTNTHASRQPRVDCRCDGGDRSTQSHHCPKRVGTHARPSSSSLGAGVVRFRDGSDSSRSALAVANLHS